MKDNFLERGIEEVIDKEHLIERLQKGEKLRIKFGVDPTAPDIHLGHTVVFRKLKEAQTRGHTVVLVIGDYTAKIGDPSGRKKTRPMLEDKEIERNAKTYLKQIGKILDNKHLEVQKNSKWFGKLGLNGLMKIMANFTLAQVIERDDFAKRLKAGDDISLQELLYPVMQAYDSVMVKADVEIGGTDQKFNLLAGRHLQKKMGQAPQDIMTVPLLVGVDGKEKMSKSLGNAVGVADQPVEIFGKIMSIPDELIMPYFSLVTDLSEGGLNMVKKELAEGANPRDVKARLAYLLVELYYDSEHADVAASEFNRTFKDKKVPTKIPEVKLKGKRCGMAPNLLMELGLVKSKSEARRLIEQGGVKFDQAPIGDPEAVICLHHGMIIQIGKRKFLRVKAGRIKGPKR